MKKLNQQHKKAQNLLFLPLLLLALFSCKSKDSEPEKSFIIGQDEKRPNVITIVTDKKPGEQLVLGYVSANGEPVSFEGAEGKHRDGGYSSLTIKSPIIKIVGAIALFECGGVYDANGVLASKPNKIKSLVVSPSPALSRIACADNIIDQIDLRQATNLERFAAGNNLLKEIDFTQNHKLEMAFLYHNKLKTIDFSHNPDLEILSCYDNELEKLDLRNNKRLGGVFLQGNKLSSLDFSACERLVKVICFSNRLFGAEMSKMLESLRSNPPKENSLILVDKTDSEEENRANSEDIALVKKRGWKPTSLEKEAGKIVEKDYEGEKDSPSKERKGHGKWRTEQERLTQAERQNFRI